MLPPQYVSYGYVSAGVTVVDSDLVDLETCNLNTVSCLLLLTRHVASDCAPHRSKVPLSSPRGVPLFVVVVNRGFSGVHQ